jgi:hypothetical protein
VLGDTLLLSRLRLLTCRRFCAALRPAISMAASMTVSSLKGALDNISLLACKDTWMAEIRCNPSRYPRRHLHAQTIALCQTAMKHEALHCPQLL